MYAQLTEALQIKGGNATLARVGTSGSASRGRSMFGSNSELFTASPAVVMENGNAQLNNAFGRSVGPLETDLPLDITNLAMVIISIVFSVIGGFGLTTVLWRKGLATLQKSTEQERINFVVEKTSDRSTGIQIQWYVG